MYDIQTKMKFERGKKMPVVQEVYDLHELVAITQSTDWLEFWNCEPIGELWLLISGMKNTPPTRALKKTLDEFTKP